MKKEFCKLAKKSDASDKGKLDFISKSLVIRFVVLYCFFFLLRTCDMFLKCNYVCTDAISGKNLDLRLCIIIDVMSIL